MVITILVIDSSTNHKTNAENVMNECGNGKNVEWDVFSHIVSAFCSLLTALYLYIFVCEKQVGGDPVGK
jgi:hypothetical protein